VARAFSHVGLSTLDMEATRAFYEGVLGFRAVRCDVMEIEEGGRIRHVFFDAGDGQLIASVGALGCVGLPPPHAIHEARRTTSIAIRRIGDRRPR